MKIDLELSTAQAGWNRGENDNKWCVRQPDGEILFVLDGNFDEKSAMQAIHLGRIYETKAFNIGITYGKELQAKTDMDELVKLRSAVKHLGEYRPRDRIILS